jgi:ABC-type branched-subunit amino acid transport system ATPase component
MTAAVPALEVERVSKRFGGVEAIREASFSVAPGTVLGLIGPNGAGKSTMLGVIAGAVRPDAGWVRIFGQPSPGDPHRVARLGVGRTFQIPQEFGRLTVLENLLVASPLGPAEGLAAALAGRRAWRAREEAALAEAWALLARFKLDGLANEPAATLSGGQKKLLEFARALASRPRLLLLDEPTAGVAPSLRPVLEAAIAQAAAQGATVLMIEHEMGVVARLSTEVVVMAEGTVIARGRFDEIARDARVISAYLGQRLEVAGHA